MLAEALEILVRAGLLGQDGPSPGDAFRHFPDLLAAGEGFPAFGRGFGNFHGGTHAKDSLRTGESINPYSFNPRSRGFHPGNKRAPYTFIQ
jgi:hypothetical protein